MNTQVGQPYNSLFGIVLLLKWSNPLVFVSIRWPLGYLILQGSRRYFLAALGLVYPLNRFLSDTWSSKSRFLAFCSFVHVFSHSESYNCTLHWEFRLLTVRNRKDKNALNIMEKNHTHAKLWLLEPNTVDIIQACNSGARQLHHRRLRAHIHS